MKKKPSQRGRKRYITFRVHSEDRLDFLNIRGAVWNSLEHWLGEQDLAQANIRIIKNLWNSKTQTGFIQCDHRYTDLVKTGLALVHQIGDERVILQTLRVSGTIKSAKKNLDGKAGI